MVRVWVRTHLYLVEPSICLSLFDPGESGEGVGRPGKGDFRLGEGVRVERRTVRRRMSSPDPRPVARVVGVSGRETLAGEVRAGTGTAPVRRAPLLRSPLLWRLPRPGVRTFSVLGDRSPAGARVPANVLPSGGRTVRRVERAATSLI